ncbi:MAG TPA: hypothetical protein VJ598_13265 [Albitalea sp.]|nr:hypothetical protein [Albitalea sp.]
MFALPRFAFVSAAPTRWMASPPPPAPAAPPPIPLLQMQAQAARDAALAQIMSTLQQQAAAWAAPLEASDGTCLLAAEPTTPLACDNDALLALIGERVAMLSGLLSAYRRMEPRAASLSIALVQGHYRVALGLADEAQAPRQ